MKRRNFLKFFAGLPALALFLWFGRKPVAIQPVTFFVDLARGSDGNSGLSPNEALAKMSVADSKMKTGDVVYLLNTNRADVRRAVFTA